MDVHGRHTPDPFDESDRDLIAAITPDVMKCLAKWKFFEALDDRLCPADESKVRERCAGNYAISEAILHALGRDDMEFADIFDVLRAQGGFCDCEILYNVMQENRLKSEYWRAQYTKLESQDTQSK
jgi:hypothetical protein